VCRRLRRRRRRLQHPRLDFDGHRIAGGYSPGFLNWDAELRAEKAELDLGRPDGIDVTGESPSALADTAIAWFQTHIREWRTSARRARWDHS
jgi:hypothetical protein